MLPCFTLIPTGLQHDQTFTLDPNYKQATATAKPEALTPDYIPSKVLPSSNG